MIDVTNNTPVGITHIWPYSKLINPDAQPLSNEREADVWDELRDLTFDDERGCIAVATHSPYQDDEDAFSQQLKREIVVGNRVRFYTSRTVDLEIHHPAEAARTSDCVRNAKEHSFIEIPARPARTETRQDEIPFNLGSKQDADSVIKDYRDGVVRVLVLWFPDDSEHLRYLPRVTKACPELLIYVFHCEYRNDKWGVEREETCAGSWQTRFHTKTEALTIPENVDVVVRGICNVGSVSMWGALPKHGKSYLFLSIMKALLSGRPWLDHFEVSQSKRVVYLVPEVGLRGVMKRLRKLGMVDFLYDLVTNPDGCLFIQTLSSRDKLKLDDAALLQAVQGADVFVDPIIRYIEGEENNASDQRILSNKLLALISASARSVWCAHHSPKAFKDVTDITTQNVLRGTGEFAAFPDIIFGVLKTNDETSRLYIKCTDARDDDEYLGDFEVEMRPWIDETGDLKLVVAPGTGTPLREQRRETTNNDERKNKALEMAKEGKTRNEICDAVKCGPNTLTKWIKQQKLDFDANHDQESAA